MKTLIELEDNECRFPYGGDNGQPITFCAEPKQDGSSYCARCHEICWIKPRAPKTKHFVGAAA